METIWTRETASFRVALSCEATTPDDLSWDDTGEVRANLDSGLWTCFIFKVAVIDKGTGAEIGTDYLGDSIYENASDFIDHRACGRQNREYAAKGESGRCGSYFTQMVHSAISEARATYATARPFLRKAA